MSIQLSGEKELQQKLRNIAEGAEPIGVSIVAVGCIVMRSAVRSAVPGATKREVGYRLKVDGANVTGRVGITKFPTRGQNRRGPHLLFIDRGTKYIAARRYVATALQGARARAIAAMRSAAKRKIRLIVEQ